MHLVETKKDDAVPVSEKYMLTIKEAAAYFNIGIKKLRRIAEDNLGTVAVYCGMNLSIFQRNYSAPSRWIRKFGSMTEGLLSTSCLD